MALICLKCMKIDRPEIFVIERIPTASLCDTHGVAMVNLVERSEFVPTEEQLKGYRDLRQEVEVMVEELSPSFEEVDNMDTRELFALAQKLNMAVVEGMELESIREGIKATLRY